jgi:signal transduction histidine kinase
MKLNIRKKLVILTTTVLAVAVATFASLAIITVVKQGNEDLAIYRSTEIEKVRTQLKDYIDMAHQSVESNYNAIESKTYLEKFYGHRLRSIMDIAIAAIEKRAQMVESGKLSLAEAQEQAIHDIEAMRFDNKTGYIWINDTLLPYPRMIMHPTVPELNGNILDDAKFNCAMGRNQNLFQAAVEVSKAQTKGFVNYVWPKPTPAGLIPDVKKLSFVHAYEKWGWVLGTGIYIDDAQSDVMATILENLKTLKYNDGEGYFWVNDLSLPFPKMIMHPQQPELDGKVLNDTSFNTLKGSNENIFAAMVTKADKEGHGYVEYTWLNPLTNRNEPKLTYVRKFEPLNWMIGTGSFISHIEETILAREKEIKNNVKMIILIVIGLSLLLIVIGYFATVYMSDILVKGITLVKTSLQKLSLGEKIDTLQVKSDDEIGEMIVSLNSFVAGINSYTQFAEEIGKGNLDSNFKSLSENDVLGNSLVKMRNNLKSISQTEEERKWQNEGIAFFSELIRKHSHDLKELCVEFNRHLVKYLNANQSGLYIIQQDEQNEPYLEMKACYAFNRKKYLTNKVLLGEGLLGQAVLEKDYIYLTDLPEDFVKIESGLGDANPTCFFINPLISNDEVQGAIEIASFNKLKTYEIEFIKKICENFASSITSAKVSEKTQALLQETQTMTEMMKAQEEELRQNNEELQATQEELTRKLKEMENRELEK